MRRNRLIVQNRCCHLIRRLAHRAFFLDDKEKGLVARTNQDRPMSPVQEHKLA
jgi:hypothetical protein